MIRRRRGDEIDWPYVLTLLGIAGVLLVVTLAVQSSQDRRCQAAGGTVYRTRYSYACVVGGREVKT